MFYKSNQKKTELLNKICQNTRTVLNTKKRHTYAKVEQRYEMLENIFEIQGLSLSLV